MVFLERVFVWKKRKQKRADTFFFFDCLVKVEERIHRVSSSILFRKVLFLSTQAYYFVRIFFFF